MQKPPELRNGAPRDFFPSMDERPLPHGPERSDFETLLEELAEIIENESGVLTP